MLHLAKRIGTTRRLTVATPAYLKAHGTLKHPFDLKAHACIVYTRLAIGNRWTYRGPNGEDVAVEVGGRLRVNSSEGVRAGVLQGLGIGLVPMWLLKGDVERGDLAVLLDDYASTPLPIQAVYPSRRFVPGRTRAMLDYLAGAFAAKPAMQR